MNNLNSPRAHRSSLAEGAVFAVGIALLATACTPAEDGDTKSAGFQLTDSMATRIAMDTVKELPMQGDLDLNGRIAADDSRMADVYPIVGGQVVSVDVELGDHVTKGQTLAVIRSSQVADYERQLIDAQSDVRVAEKNVKVQQDLFDSHLLSERDLIAAQQDLAKAQAQLKQIEEAFSIYHLEDGSEYVVKAPMSGYIVNKAVSKDVTLPSDHNERIFTIAELDEVWVLAEVYESDIARVAVGMPADITTLSYPDTAFHGKVDKIFNILDPETRTMQVRVKLSNLKTLLKPEMIAHVHLSFEENRTLPSIPATAIVFDNSRQYVMVYHSRNDISTREVTVKRTAGGRAWVDSGLKPGEVIISKGQLFIYDALNDR